MSKTWRGRNVYLFSGKYPSVSWGDHPASLPGSYHCPIHRVVAYEKYGGLPSGFHVHHLDGDPTNNDPNNLELIDEKGHAIKHYQQGDYDHLRSGTKHSVEVVSLYCDVCGYHITRKPSDVNKTNNYCSHECYSKDSERTDWPSKGALRRAVHEHTLDEVSTLLGVSITAVRKRLGRY